MRTLFLAALGALLLGGPQRAEAAGDAPKIEWIRDFAAGRDQAAATGRPILLNFYCGT